LHGYRKTYFARLGADFGFDRLLLDRGPLHLAHRTRRRRLGLERLEEPERAPELSQRRAAIAQQRVERPRAIAIADQRHTEIPLAPQIMPEQLVLDALGTLEPPDGAGDAPGEHALHRALRGQLRE
jgi:hypothetical protein